MQEDKGIQAFTVRVPDELYGKGKPERGNREGVGNVSDGSAARAIAGTVTWAGASSAARALDTG
jgi:hypothetical protein